jgi:O-succinylbenzoic acid--CoA ligase
VTRPLRAVPAGRVDALTAALRAALDGSGPAVLPVPDAPPADPPGDPRGGPHEHHASPPTPSHVPDDVAAVVATSGSTGTPRGVMLSASALRASAAATDARLGGPAQWLLALPPEHVAGLQVVVRSLLAGTEPVVLDPAGGFRPDAFAAATGRLTADRRYVSLVPTQLHRLLDDDAGRAALLAYDAVLLGGAATPPALLSRARDTGARVVTTYGMSETCGGGVYDGVPLDGVRVRLSPDDAIEITGPVLATGYLDRPDLDARTFAEQDGDRWLRTQDLGRVYAGRLTVLGRADDVLVTGGVKVPPAAVERVLAELPEVGEVCVVGVPDAEWGQAVVAVVVPRDRRTSPALAQVREPVTRTLGAPAAPRHVVVVERLPLRGPGKVDRRAVADLAAARLARPAGS